MIKKRNPGKLKKTIWRLLWLLSGVMLLTACGDKEQERKLGVDGYVYAAREVQEYDTLGDCRAQRKYFKEAGGYLYYLDRSLYRIPIGENLDFGTGERVVSLASLLTFDDQEITDFTVDEELNVYYCIVSISEMNFAVCKRSAEGKQLYQIPIEGEKMPDSISAKQSFIAEDGKGNVYVLSADSLLRIDDEGKLTGKLSLAENLLAGNDMWNYLMEMPGGKVYFISDRGEERKIYEVTEGDIPQLKPDEQAEKAGGSSMNGLYECSAGLLIMGDDGYLYQYDIRTGVTEKVLRWEDSGIYRGNVQVIVQVGEDCFFVSGKKGNNWSEYEGLLLFRTAVEELPEKEMIVLASLYPSFDLEAAVIDFNRISEQYHVTIEFYGSSIGEREGAEVRLDSSLTTKEPPDLLDVTNITLFNKYVNKGILEDLYEYMGEDSGIRKEDFLSNVVEGYTLDGKLICIPQSFRIRTAYSNDPALEGIEEWTLENLMVLEERYEDRKLFPTDSRYGQEWWRKYAIEEIYSSYYLEEYVDWEKGECSFDSQSFCRLLQWMKDQISKEAEKSLLEVGSVNDFDMWEYVLITCGRDTKVYGFPTADGNMAHDVWAENAIGMVANSAHKEGAWAFLQYYLQRGYESDHNGFPTRLDQLKARADEKMELLYVTYRNGERYVDENGNYEIVQKTREVNGERVAVPYMIQSEVDVLLEGLKTINFTPRTTPENMIISIVLEEAEDFFSGDKSAEETAGIIQNRVKLLLQERK